MKLMKLVADYAVKHQDRADFKHSSGYAKAQSGDNFGAASIASFEARKALNESRKFVKGYGESKVGNVHYQGPEAKKYDKTRGEIETSDEKTEIIDLKKTAENRAQFVASNQDKKAKVILGDAKAPQVPKHFGGI